MKRILFFVVVATLTLSQLAVSLLDRVKAAGPATYYVRPDGGTSSQCTGLADAPYPGSGENQPCGWDHPFRALPPEGTPRIFAGDTLIITSGSYMMGLGAPGAEACASDYPWDCYLLPIPSGPNVDNPTRILGAGWDTGCPNPPELWGTERANMIVNLTDVSNVEIGCLEITDHSQCVTFHSGDLTCQRDTYPYGEWAVRGIYAEDSANVHLQNLNIHGLANAGVHAGRLANWTVEQVRVAGNGWVGWDGDIDGNDSNSGMLTFRNWTVEWNGCGETYPGGQPTGCWGQSAGGYGDGVGTGATGGNWIIETSRFLHNTSDGLDLLYHRLGGSITLKQVHAEGNAGDQIKVNGPTNIENMITVSNCGSFAGQPYTHHVDNCRAGGSALALYMGQGDRITVRNSTVTGEGDCLIIAECDENANCDGSEAVQMRNNIFQGQIDFTQNFENTCLFWYGESALPSNPFDIDYSIITNTKNIPPCPGSHDLCETSTGLVNTSIDNFNAHLLPNSPAIDAGDDTACPTTDYWGGARPADGDENGTATCDIGAHEFLGAFDKWAYLPIITKQ